MTINDYKRAKAERISSETKPRAQCLRCRKPASTCICQLVKPFPSDPQFVILIHRDEARRNIATGRMAHLCLENSHLIEGTNFSENNEVNDLIHNPENHCMVLFPSIEATQVSRANTKEFFGSLPADKNIIVFVIDGTWAQARRMRRLSENLRRLPHISFQPETPSHFLVRQQPAKYCYSTIESIHVLIDWAHGNSTHHNNLLEVFSYMVNLQIKYETHYGVRRGFRPTRGERERAVSFQPNDETPNGSP